MNYVNCLDNVPSNSDIVIKYLPINDVVITTCDCGLMYLRRCADFDAE